MTGSDPVKFIKLTMSFKKTPIIIGLHQIVCMKPRYQNGNGTILILTSGEHTHSIGGGFRNERLEVVESMQEIEGWLRVKNK